MALWMDMKASFVPCQTEESGRKSLGEYPGISGVLVNN